MPLRPARRCDDVQKLGLVRSWPDTMDRGVFEITKKQADFMVFRADARNVAMTAPYFHDGSVSSRAGGGAA